MGFDRLADGRPSTTIKHSSAAVADDWGGTSAECTVGVADLMECPVRSSSAEVPVVTITSDDEHESAPAECTVGVAVLMERPVSADESVVTITSDDEHKSAAEQAASTTTAELVPAEFEAIGGCCSTRLRETLKT